MNIGQALGRHTAALGAPRLDPLWCGGVALALRGAFAAWAGVRFPAVEDGRFYHAVAARIARGYGYTWAWPDGTVTFAAHYPVGYPGLMGLFYAAFGSHASVAMLLNAVLGALSVYWLHRLVALRAPRWAANAAALSLALHPTLFAYTAAVMTEGSAAALVVGACWFAVPLGRKAPDRARAALFCGLMGLAVLVRPQLVVLAPALGWCRSRWAGWDWAHALGSATLVTAGCLLVVAPWTVRNCQRMDQCVFVSANKGWNLLIGTARAGEGKWISVDRIGVPAECRNVFGEAAKDECFYRAGVARIVAAPLGWAALVPKKLRATFDDVGAPGGYLRTSNPALVGDGFARAFAVAEAVVQRGTLLAAVLVLGFRSGLRRRFRIALGVIGILTIGPAAWIATLLVAAWAWSAGGWKTPALGAASLVIVATAGVHAAFFGAARYGMAVLPLLVGLPFAALRAWSSEASDPPVSAEVPTGAPGGPLGLQRELKAELGTHFRPAGWVAAAIVGHDQWLRLFDRGLGGGR